MGCRGEKGVGGWHEVGWENQVAFLIGGSVSFKVICCKAVYQRPFSIPHCCPGFRPVRGSLGGSRSGGPSSP